MKKNSFKKIKKILPAGLIVAFASINCFGNASVVTEYILPASDPNNLDGWVLNLDISDEFERKTLDDSKWFVQGKNNQYYIWKGRSPSQFAPHNVIVEDGKLKIRTQWEDDFKFSDEDYPNGKLGSEAYGVHEGKPLPITTGAVISKKRFLYGYMEAKTKLGNAAMTSAFWAIGYQQELDIFEQNGNPKKVGNIRADTSLATGHDWSPPAQRPTWVFQHSQELPYRTADEFHVYGAEWGPDYLKIFIDGKLVHSFTQDDVGLSWILNNPMEIWFDSEIFKWLGMPHKEELPVDFEIEYIRVWQKPDSNLLAPAFYGFEGPILFEENPRPLLGSKSKKKKAQKSKAYQQFWSIEERSEKFLTIVKGEEYATGLKSLKFSGYGKTDTLELDEVIALTPKGSVNVPSGSFVVSMKLWLDQGSVADKIYLDFLNPSLTLEFSDLHDLPRRQWVTLKKYISRKKSSQEDDQIRLKIRKKDLPEIKAAKFFIDDISIKPAN